MDTDERFTSSIILDNHPMQFMKKKLKVQYYLVLEYFIKQFEIDEYINLRLNQYEVFLLEGTQKPQLSQNALNHLVKSIISCRLLPWRNKYRYWIMCDIALILLDESTVKKASDSIKLFLNPRCQAKFDILLSAFKDKNVDTTSISFANNLIEQYYKNYQFLKKKEFRFIVTANMSAGKSTLINALIGKKLTRTSQEACTGNICYIHNKAFDDNCTHLKTLSLNLNATLSELKNFDWETTVNIATHFKLLNEQEVRVCIIDTPGVNYSLNKEHKKLTIDSLNNEIYDKLIYLLNANKLGTDEEMMYLKWISKNIPMNKVIFVINKLDDFRYNEDDIEKSIENVRNDLVTLGYENPTICPISAYFALLIKQKYNGIHLTEDEEDEYKLYTKKFKKSFYDLSRYYSNIENNENDNENIFISKKCGLYGLEKILFGGIL